MDLSPYRELFVAEARDHLTRLGDGVLGLEKDTSNRELIDAVFRSAHSIKGMAASMELPVITELAHAMEDLMDRVRKGRLPFDGAAADLLLAAVDLLAGMVNDVANGHSTVRDSARIGEQLSGYGTGREGDGTVRGAVPVVQEAALPPSSVEEPRRELAERLRAVRVRADILDRLVNFAGELVTSKNRIAELGRELASEGLLEASRELSRLVRDLGDEVMAVRMMPVSSLCERFPRTVRDVARRGNKQAVLVIEGGDVELDRGLLELLADPLVHILRNAVDHGIEPPEQRVAAGKPAEGRIVLSARREKDRLILTVADDGRGIDPGCLVTAAVARGLMTLEAGQALAPHEALQIICLPGFSTATTVSEVSGRGVGMDAVQEAVRQVGGLLSITSVPGQGTVFTLTLPLTVSIIPVLTIETGGLTMAVPVAAVTRTLEVHSHDILSDGSGELFAVQGEDEPVPLLRLDQLIGRTVCLPAHGVVTVLVTDMGGGLAGVAVDRVVGQVELFAKPLGRPLSRVRGLSAGAMLGNGQVVFVLDLPGLLRTARTGRSAGGVC